jgi:hypothetical protein
MALTRTQLANPDCPVSDGDYEAIEAAIMETARGRWFLFEYARRNRHADTRTLLSAINRLESAMTGPPRPAGAYIVNTQVSAAAYSGQAATARQLRVVHAAAPLEIAPVAAVDTAPAPAVAEAAPPARQPACFVDKDTFVFTV